MQKRTRSGRVDARSGRGKIGAGGRAADFTSDWDLGKTGSGGPGHGPAVGARDLGPVGPVGNRPDPTEHGIAATRIDAHCHSNASDGPAVPALGIINCPECYSEPEQVYDQAIARGMDLVTITDHNTIAGAMTLVDRGFERFIVGQEVSVRFPEDRCMLHVLVWGLTPTLDDQLTREKLRGDVYAFAAWLRQNNLPHALAHPLYIQNGKLTRWHVERATLLFKGFECLNGAHSYTVSDAISRFLDGLTAEAIAAMASVHGIQPVWPDAHIKARTGGSDDHGLLNIGRTYTEVPSVDGEKINDPRLFFERVMRGEGASAGVGGHSALLAHQLATVGAHYYADRIFEKRSPTGRYLSGKLLRFAGVKVKTPSRKRVAAYKLAQKMALPRKARRKSLPLVRALRREMRGVLDQYPHISRRLDPDTWAGGAAVSEHEHMAEFVQELTAALSRAMAPGVMKSLKKRDPTGLVEHGLSYALLHVAQLPYLFSLFYQNKDRNFLERFEHETSAAGAGVSVLERPMRVSLFTDTITDVNGVCRFINNVADQAHVSGRDLEVITSTRTPLPAGASPNIYNFAPVFATSVPKYDNLDIALPPIMKILRHCDQHQPDVIHISTPGPVGCVGFLAAKMLRIPVLGVYHTDFPAYVDQLFDDQGMTSACEKFMRAFYKPFSAVFTRSEDYVEGLVKLGLPREKMVSLLPGFENGAFHPRFRAEQIWDRLGLNQESVKVLYVGRVSVEKNMPLMTEIWKAAHERLSAAGIEAELVVVGDGPYREQMAKETKNCNARFLGFRYGDELSAIYASSDFFVFPSTTDTLGQVVMESQGSGLPVIVTDQGGPKEVVEHGRTGYVLSAHDKRGWVNRIVELCSDADQRRGMGAAAHDSMQKYSLIHSFEHFWSVHTDAWHEHLTRIGVSKSTAGGAGGVATPVSDEAESNQFPPTGPSANRPETNGSADGSADGVAFDRSETGEPATSTGG